MPILRSAAADTTLRQQTATMPRQVISIRKRMVQSNHAPELRWTCGFPYCAHTERGPVDMRQHIRAQHTAENVGTDYEWLTESSDIYHDPDDVCYVKAMKDGEVVCRSFVVGDGSW